MIDDEWSGSLHLNIWGVRALYDHLDYSIKMWPGSPARPREEQAMLIALKEEMFKMKMEHNIVHNTGTKNQD